MQQALTAVLERDATFSGEFFTEPYEVPWASEARFFVHILSVTGEQVEAGFVTQISPDGLTWCDASADEHVGSEPGLVTWPVLQFGQWLRLRGRISGTDAAATLRIYLTAKG